MGLFDALFGNRDPGKQIDKARKRLTDRYRQTYERYEAMDELSRLGTAEALTALLQRFTIRVDGPTVDEEEKTYCYELLRKAGDAALEPIEAFVQKSTAVYFPLRALRDITGDDRAVDVLLKAMNDCDPGYHEGLERMREIVSNLRDFQHPRVRDALHTLLDSRSDEIRFFALDGLSSYPGPEVIEAFAKRIAEDESQRVRAFAAEIAVQQGLDLSPFAETVRAGLGPQYRLGDDGLVVRG